MLTVTDEAAAHMANLLNQNDVPDDATLRFVVQDNALGIELSKSQPDDQTVEHDGRTVLVLGEDVSKILEERTLDIEQTQEGPKLAVK